MKWQAKDNPTVAELAWAAGALDGEGCIGVYQMPSGKSRYLQLTVMVENTDPRMPLKFQEIFGGTVRLCKRQYSEKDRPATVWQIAGKKVGPMLQSMLPYLVIKKEQAEIAILYANTIGKPGHAIEPSTWSKREELRGQLVLLKGRR